MDQGHRLPTGSVTWLEGASVELNFILCYWKSHGFSYLQYELQEKCLFGKINKQ